MKIAIKEIRSFIRTTLLESQKANELEKLASNLGKFIHFSSSDRAGISYNKGIHPGNPRAFYGFPLTERVLAAIVAGNREEFDDYGEKKYIYVFEVNGNVLDLEKFDLESEFTKVYEWAKTKPEIMRTLSSWLTVEDVKRGAWLGRAWAHDGQNLFMFLHEIARHMRFGNLSKDEHSAMNVLMRKIMGYDAVITTHGGFGDGIREQIAVLTPTSISLIHKLNNPMGLTKEELAKLAKEEAERAARRAEWDLEQQARIDRLKKAAEDARKREIEAGERAAAEWDLRYSRKK